jgi:amino acid adenylation domain-containing protein
MSAPSPARPYSRRIVPDEWVFLATPAGLGVEIQLCVEGDGGVDPAALGAALAAAGDQCPGTRLVRRGRRWVDSGVPPAVRVAEPGAGGRPDFASPLLRTRLAGRDTGSCEVVLLRGTPAALVFRAHHGVMDGKGVIFWATQVFRALNGEPVTPATSALHVEEIMAEIAAAHGTALPPAARAQDVPRESIFGPLPGAPHRTVRRGRVIDGYHPAVAAKVIREVASYGNGTGLVLVPVDLRQYLPGLCTTGEASGSVRVAVAAEDDWSDVQANLLTAMSERQYLASRGSPFLLRLPLPVMRGLYRWLDRRFVADEQFMTKAGIVDFIASVSHLGRVEVADLCAAGFEATSCYSLADGVLVPTIDIVESGGHTHVSVGWRDGPGVTEHMERLLDRIEERLSPRAYRDWDGNRTRREAPDATLTELFAAQVARTPDATAVSGPDGDLTYAELDRRASALAAGLRSRGLGRGDRIGLVSGRSAAAVVAVWGILRAGAAYIPIDASYPDARIAQFLADAHAPACLFEPALPGPGSGERGRGERDFLPPGCAGISLGSFPGAPPPRWQNDAPPGPGDLAYVVYTSGSTGAPKGVEIEHRNVVSYVRWALPDSGIDAGTRMLLIPSISFDVAGCAFFLPLLAGGAVLPVRDVNAVTLREALEDSGATAMAITPSHLDIINRAGVRRATMRVVMTIGEVLRRSTALRAREVLGPECRILNQYGPAETTIVNTSHEFDPAADTDPGVPFGRPMDNNTVHVMDSHGRFAAPGEPGEAYIGGSQVGRGYLGRPGLTRQRFVRLADGSRVYRTGDIVRLLPGGELTFVSRADDQVKVAGHRVEPAEIACVLEEHPHVRQAAVVPRTRPGRQDKELCAYVAGDGTAGPDDWKEFLAERLPRYMVPAVVVPVPEIPLNPNGKVDAKRLPDPFTAPEPPAAPGGRPGGAGDRDDVTAAVAAVWARTLQVSDGLLDEQADFHQLGGNSLLLLAMIDEVLGPVAARGQAAYRDGLARIIKEPTLAQVSALVRELSDGGRMPRETA